VGGTGDRQLRQPGGSTIEPGVRRPDLHNLHVVQRRLAMRLCHHRDWWGVLRRWVDWLRLPKRVFGNEHVPSGLHLSGKYLLWHSGLLPEQHRV
jgi:hypothetical protein